MNTTAIAQHLNIAPQAVIEIQEWASVIWVKFQGGCRFVSKKIMGNAEFDVMPGKLVSETVTGAVKKALHWKGKGKKALYDLQIEKLIKWEKEDMVKNSGLGIPLAQKVENQTKSYIRSFLNFEEIR